MKRPNISKEKKDSKDEHQEKSDVMNSRNSSSSSAPNPAQSSNNAVLVWFYCSLLALQFGLQPLLSSRFTGLSVSKASVVIGTEIAKIIIAAVFIFLEPAGERQKIWSSWSIMDSLKVAALPATIYAIQNVLVQYAYEYLDSMTFNLLNQTKTLSAAFWLWVMLGQKQSLIQMFALLLLLLTAVLLNMKGPSGSSSSSTAASVYYQYGLMYVIIASLTSGLAAALTQKALVNSSPRHPMFFSAELAVYGILFLLVQNYIAFQQGKTSDFLLSSQIFSNWDVYTLIPVLANAFGGLIVGLVTKYAGGVIKGFALVAGIILTAVAQWIVESKPLGPEHWVAIVLVSVAIVLHSKFPVPKDPSPSSKASSNSNNKKD